MPLPYPKPISRAMARSNAIYFAEQAINPSASGMAQLDLDAARAWAAIAETFPYEETVVVDNLSGIQDQIMDQFSYASEMPDDSPYVAPGVDGRSTPPVIPGPVPEDDEPTTMVLHLGPRTAIIVPSGLDPAMPTPIEVDSLGYDVLRVLAARYVRSSLNRAVVIDPNSDDLTTPDYTLRMVLFEGMITVEPDQS